MHELSIAEAVVDQITHRTNGAGITRVCLEVGRLSGVVPDALRFCFDLVADGTALHGAALEIVDREGLARCGRCHVEFALADLLGLCRCGSPDWEILEGHELRIKEVEVT